jgi:hypothetical protein
MIPILNAYFQMQPKMIAYQDSFANDIIHENMFILLRGRSSKTVDSSCIITVEFCSVILVKINKLDVWVPFVT